jgi:hypothetical protein
MTTPVSARLGEIAEWLKGLEACARYDIRLGASDLPKIQQTAALLSLVAQYQEAGWRPIETFDGRSEAVLVWCPDRQNHYTAYNRNGAWLFFGGVGTYAITERVTHWCEFPAPPRAAAILGPSAVALSSDPQPGEK